MRVSARLLYRKGICFQLSVTSDLILGNWIFCLFYSFTFQRNKLNHSLTQYFSNLIPSRLTSPYIILSRIAYPMTIKLCSGDLETLWLILG